MDAKYHHEWALEILSGNFWGDTVFFRAPLYPYLLALLYKVSGESNAFAIFFQHLIGTSTAVLIYLLARQYFALRVALVAGVYCMLPFTAFLPVGTLLGALVRLHERSQPAAEIDASRTSAAPPIEAEYDSRWDDP